MGRSGGPVSNNQHNIISLLLMLARKFMKLLRIGHRGFERCGEILIVTRREGAGLRHKM